MIRALLEGNFKNVFYNKKIMYVIFSFIIIVSIFNIVFFNNYKNTASFDINIIDSDKSPLSKEFIDILSENELINLKIIDSLEIKSLNNEKLQGIYVIDKDFHNKLEAGKYDDLLSVYYLKNNIIAPVLSDIIAKDLLAVISATKTSNSLDFYYKKLNIESENNSYNRVIDYYSNKQFKLNFEYEIKNTESNTIDYGVIQKKASLGITILFSTIFIVILIGMTENKNHRSIQKKLNIYDPNGINRYLATTIFLFIVSILILSLALMSVLWKYSTIGKLMLFIPYTALFLIDILILIQLLQSFFSNNIKFQTNCPLILLLLSILGEGIFSSDFLPEYIKVFAHISPYSHYCKFIYDNFILAYSNDNIYYLIGLIGIALVLSLLLMIVNSRHTIVEKSV